MEFRFIQIGKTPAESVAKGALCHLRKLKGLCPSARGLQPLKGPKIKLMIRTSLWVHSERILVGRGAGATGSGKQGQPGRRDRAAGRRVPDAVAAATAAGRPRDGRAPADPAGASVTASCINRWFGRAVEGKRPHGSACAKLGGDVERRDHQCNFTD